MNVDFTEFEEGLSKCKLRQIQDDCLKASGNCPQSLDYRDCPTNMSSKVLDFWCKSSVLFKSGYSIYLKESTIKLLLKYKAYKILKEL